MGRITKWAGIRSVVFNIVKRREKKKQVSIMNDKEKIKKSLQEIHDFKRLYVKQLALFSCENSPRYEKLLKEIVKTLS